MDVIYFPINDSQKVLKVRWDKAKLLILTGPAGCGKTAGALGQALMDMKGKRVAKLFLARPTISVDEQLGFMPGSMEEKLGVWAGAFKDCLGDLTYASLEDFDTELVAVGMLRGRTIKNAILIVDEAQNLTFNQLKCIVTRMGKNAKIILCGDPRQSDITSRTNPLEEISKKLMHLEGCCCIQFPKSDQVREPFVNIVLEALGE